ncbi:MAG: 2-hydroxyacid dehydrogenase, partial [Alphaproteobacteria bacterium]|nr:2-hydroxyacid dehydrogenase [Alphaproteobacteria bacterium]
MKIEVLTTATQSDIVESGLAKAYVVHRLGDAPDRNGLLEEVGGRIRAIVGWTVDAKLMDKCPNLEVIANPGVGYDGIEIDAAIERKVRVTNTPDVLTDAVAEITLGLMIGLCRRIVPADRYVREGKWAQANYEFTGELTGRTVGILGLGRIGKEIAVRCLAMKMRVVYFGRNRQAHQPYIYYDRLEDMARDCDWLVVMAPGGPGTDAIVSRTVLEQLGPKGMLVNMARGSLVDE